MMKKHYKGLRNIVISALLLVASIVCVQALEVNRNELQSVDSSTITFNNYNGPHTVIDSLAAIRNIGTQLGRSLGSDLTSTKTAGSENRYYVIHAVDATTGKLDADIFILGKNAGVDHVRNLRHIVAAYLVETYKYSEKDAMTLATFITVYNAVYRGKLDVFQSKYKDIVTKYLHADKVGLSVNWEDWAGKTEMVIPLADIAGGLSTIDTSVISDKNVINSMRESDDRGIDERKNMVGIKDREADSAEQNAENAAKQAVQENRKLSEEQKKLAEEQAKSSDAQKAADNAQKAADNAQKAADEAQKQADVANESAQKAANNADEASKAADEAKRAAVEANKAADEARKAADEASKAADEARKAADEAAENAKNNPNDEKAQSDAAKAQSDAEKAQSDAAKAQSDADKAQSDAAKAQSDADKKQSDADKAQSDAESEAEKAKQEQTEADKTQAEADQKAEEAASKQDEADKQKEAEKAQQEKTDEQAQKAKEAQETAEAEQKTADKKRDEAQNERKLIAQDQQQLIDEGLLDEKDAAFGLRLTDSEKELSSIVKMNAKTGRLVKTSPVNVIRERELIPVENGFVAIAGEEGANHTIRLVLIDRGDMEIQKESEDIVSPKSVLVYNGGSFYVVVQEGNGWVVAKYSANLERELKSTELVDMATPITVSANGICVTDKNGDMLVLKPLDLSAVK